MKTAETTNYEQQATDFLNKLDVKFSVKFLKHGKYFDDDKENRDIYELSLSRGSRAQSFKFGQSIANSGKYVIYTSPRQYSRTKPTNMFRHEYDLNKNFSEPTAYSLLSCLTKYDPGTFEEFCREYDYDTDSKRAEKTYNAVKEQYYKVISLFSPAELDEMQEIN